MDLRSTIMETYLPPEGKVMKWPAKTLSTNVNKREQTWTNVNKLEQTWTNFIESQFDFLGMFPDLPDFMGMFPDPRDGQQSAMEGACSQ